MKVLADTGTQHRGEIKKQPLSNLPELIHLKDFKALKVQTGLVYTEVMRVTATRAANT